MKLTDCLLNLGLNNELASIGIWPHLSIKSFELPEIEFKSSNCHFLTLFIRIIQDDRILVLDARFVSSHIGGSYRYTTEPNWQRYQVKAFQIPG
jgi:hypothetical protein